MRVGQFQHCPGRSGLLEFRLVLSILRDSVVHCTSGDVGRSWLRDASFFLVDSRCCCLVRLALVLLLVLVLLLALLRILRILLLPQILQLLLFLEEIRRGYR